VQHVYLNGVIDQQVKATADVLRTKSLSTLPALPLRDLVTTCTQHRVLPPTYPTVTTRSYSSTDSKMSARALYLWSLALLVKDTIGACSQHQPGTCSTELTASIGLAGGQNNIRKVFDYACDEIGTSGAACDPGQSIDSQLKCTIDSDDRGEARLLERISRIQLRWSQTLGRQWAESLRRLFIWVGCLL